jgi:hypothetical protein
MPTRRDEHRSSGLCVTGMDLGGRPMAVPTGCPNLVPIRRDERSPSSVAALRGTAATVSLRASFAYKTCPRQLLWTAKVPAGGSTGRAADSRPYSGAGHRRVVSGNSPDRPLYWGGSFYARNSAFRIPNFVHPIRSVKFNFFTLYTCRLLIHILFKFCLTTFCQLYIINCLLAIRGFCALSRSQIIHNLSKHATSAARSQ